MKSILFISQQFAPGHLTHVRAFVTMCEKIGLVPSLFLNEGYRAFCSDMEDDCSIYYSRPSVLEAASKQKFDLAFVVNISKFDASLIKSIRAVCPHLRTLFWYHEPYAGFYKTIHTQLTGSLEGAIDCVKSFGRHYFVKQLLKETDLVVLPSSNAESVFNETRDSRMMRAALMPLAFNDCLAGSCDTLYEKDRPYFSFISTVQEKKGFSEFLDFVKYASAKNPNLKFLIATRSDVEPYMDDSLRILIDKGCLSVKAGTPLTDEDINEAYRSTSCLWLGYHESTQSGVLAHSFMLGTPVLATSLHAFNDFVNGQNGLVVKTGDLKNLDLLYQLMNKVQCNQESFCRAARDTFEKNFDSRVLVKQFENVLGKAIA